MQGEEIDFVKHGIRTIKAPKNFKEAKKYKPYFLQKYKYHKNKNIMQEINTPLNVLCKHIEKWEKELFKQDKVKIIDTSNLLIDKELINKNKDETKRVYKELKKIYKEFKQGTSKLFLKYRFKDEDTRRNAYDSFYNTYHAKVNTISNNKELLASLAVYLTYIENKKDKKTRSYQFPWICAWEGLVKLIDKNAPEVVKVPKLLKAKELPNLDSLENVFEFKGNLYQLVETVNKISADSFIINQYDKKVEKELKQQMSKFNLIIETVLYGYKPKTTDEVIEIIKSKELCLGSKEYKGKSFAALFAENEYIAAIKDSEILDDDLGFVNLKMKRDKVNIEIIEKCKNSLKVKLRLAS